MRLFTDLAASFLKIGALGFGGGYAMLPLIQHTVVSERGWIADAGFADMLAISQLTPGPIAINAATYLGFAAAAEGAGGGWPPAVAGLLGAALATLCVCAPPVAFMMGACRLFDRLRGHPRVARILRDLRPVMIGLIAATALLLLFGPAARTFTGWMSAAVFAGALGLALFTKCHPAALLAGAGAAGFFWG